MMSGWLVSMGPAVANHMWQSTAFGVVAAGVALALRRNHARARYWIWMAASVKFMVPFALLISLGGMLPRPQHTVVTMPVYSAVDEVSLPFVDAMPVAEPTHDAIRPRHERGTQLTWLVVVWLAGFVAVLGVWCMRWRQVAGTLRRAVPANDGREAELLQLVQRTMGRVTRGRGTCVRLVLSHELMEPGVFGVFRPVLIWPARLSERLDDEHIEAILAHEVCHVRRRDNLTAALHMLVEAVFWFHPLVWWLGARLVEERERACDEEVLELCRHPQVYAESILKVCEFCVESPLACVSGVTGADLSKRVRSIMTLRLRRLGVAGKMALAALALAAIAAPVAFGVVRMIPMYGQITDTAGPLPAFEAATIKPSDPERRGIGFTTNGRHFSTVNTTASDLLQYAYGIQARQIVDAPAWLDVDKYDIAAVASEGDADPKWKLMVRKLLADRFGLTFHHDTRELPVYELRVGKNGPKLAKSGADVDQAELYFSRTSKFSAGTTLHAKAATMAGLASLLQVGPLERPVVDRTGLTGTFDFTLDFTADTTKGGDAAVVGEDTNAPAGIFTAIQEQLGLKLVAAKGPAEVVVIDHVEKPVFDDADALAKPSVVAAVLTEGQRLLGSLVPAAMVQEKVMVDGPAAAAKPFRFDVVSIRPVEPPANDGRPRQIGFQFTDDGFVATNQSLMGTLLNQYRQELQGDSSRIVGGPDWVRNLRWDIRAKVADADIAEWSKLSHDSSAEATERRNATIQAMLAERFKLKTHIETKEGAVYVLEVAKGGPKLKPSSSDVPPQVLRIGMGPGHFSSEWTTVDSLVSIFARELGHPVIDKTGITGRYDVTLDWAPTQGAAGAPGGDVGQASAPGDASASLFTAVQEQLGLKLEAQKGPIETLVIDSAEKPSVDGAEVQGSGNRDQGAAGAAYVPTMTFDVTSVRESKVDAMAGFTVGGEFAPQNSSHLRLQNNGVMNLVTWAYPAEGYQIDGWSNLPKDLGRAVFNVEAKADSASDEKLAKLSKEEVRLEQEHMMQVMLAERFKLKMHWETRDAKTYDLVIAKAGKLQSTGAPPSAEELKAWGDRGVPSLYQHGSSDHGFEYTAHGATTADIAEMLGGQFAHPVNDKTGLTGKYDFNLKTYQVRTDERKDDETNPWPPLETAIQDQLGLKVVASHGPVRFLVIDHMEMPTEN